MPDPALEDIVEQTRLDLIPEMTLYTSPEDIKALWVTLGKGQQEPPPYWAYPWPGGQALARFTLDNPDMFRGKSILDFGSGCGINTIPALMCGASTVVALDINEWALQLTKMNADLHLLNDSRLMLADTLESPDPFDIVIMGDGFYEPEMGKDVLDYLSNCIDKGIDVIVGDPKREYLPQRRCEQLGSYLVRDTQRFENRKSTPAFVYRLKEN